MHSGDDNLNSRHFGLLINKVCHLGMWNVNMHQISDGALNHKTASAVLMQVWHKLVQLVPVHF